jgi:hypothetical protein
MAIDQNDSKIPASPSEKVSTLEALLESNTSEAKVHNQEAAEAPIENESKARFESDRSDVTIHYPNGGKALPVPKCPWLLEPPQLLPGENQRDYWALLKAVWNALKPKDAIEEIWAREVVDYTWEARRLRGCQTAQHALGTTQQLRIILAQYYPELENRGDLAFRWSKHDPATIELIDKLLANAGLNVDLPRADALVYVIRTFEQIHDLILSNSIRRDAIVREVDRHRAALAPRLPQALEEVEDAEFIVVEPDPGDGADAA